MASLMVSLTQARKALLSLEQVMQEPYSDIVRDASIQRFEYTCELNWKLIKRYLAEYEGVRCSSPKDCIRKAFSTGFITEEQASIWFDCFEDRNLTSHTYIESVAESVYAHIPAYLTLFSDGITRIHERLHEK